MIFLYIYVVVATLGILSLPSIGVYQTNKNKKMLQLYGCKTWWDIDVSYPENRPAYRFCNSMTATPMPVVYLGKIVGWPIYSTILLLACFAKILAIPGKALIAKAEKSHFVLEGEKEVDKFLASAQSDNRTNR